MNKSLLILTALATLAGCTSLSGLDARSDFSCKAPEGVLCESMSGIYANAEANNLPGQRVNRRNAGAEGAGEEASQRRVMTAPVSSGMPIRSAPRVLRIWFAPWEDTDGDLHDQSYVYLPIDSGRWLIEHNQRRIQDAYRPIRAPSKTSATATEPAAAGRRSVRGMGLDSSSQITSQGEEVIGVRQDRMSNEQAAELLNGMIQPNNVMPASK